MNRKLLTVVALIGLLSIAALAEWPAIVTNKTLYAKNDLRGKKAPDFVVEAWLTGNAPKMKGKVVLIDFWATWCGPCRALIPELNTLQAKFKSDLVVIGVSDEKSDIVSEFMKKTEMRYNVAVDTQKRMSQVVGVQGIPHVLVISPDGIVRWQGFSGSEEDPLTADKIAAIIAESKKLK